MMYLAYNILNVLAIGFFLFSVARFYNRHTEYFLVLSIIFIYWIQLVISSAYIETGVYLKDIGVRSYPTGVTLRLVCMLELFLIVFSVVASRLSKIDVPRAFSGRAYDETWWIRFALICIFAYRLVDVLISGNIVTNPSLNRFNYYEMYSKLPFASVIDYFSYPLMWVCGLFFALGKGRQKAVPLLIFVFNCLTMYLRGIEFGGYLQCAVYFFVPVLIPMAKRNKLIKPKYIAFATLAIALMLVPKYMHFSDALDNNEADTSYGLNTAGDFLLYRALAQEADLTWEIDRQIVENGTIDPSRMSDELALLAGDSKTISSTQYLMNRGCSPSALIIYSYSSAAVTGGYPVLWAAILGYPFCAVPIIIDSICIILVARCIWTGIAKVKLLRLLSAAYLLCQYHTIVMSADMSSLGNLLPHIFILYLLLFGWDKKATFPVTQLPAKGRDFDEASYC